MPTERPQLSDRAERALERGGRSGAPNNTDEIETTLREANLPVFQPVVDAFYHFGGHWLPLGVNRTFRLYRSSDAIAAARYAGSNSDDQSEFRIPFGEHPAAQMSFLMDGFGTLYTDDTPVCESVHHWIEQHALMETVERWKRCVRAVLPDPPKNGLEPWANAHMRRVTPASDRFSTWWLGTQAALNRFTPWGTEPGLPKWVWLFATSQETANNMANDFNNTFGSTASDLRPWPP